MAFFSTKTYGHEQGFSCAFRQHRATHSHCSKIHGYALSIKLVFGCKELDDLNWVQDFGGLKQVKEWLQGYFDHTLCAAHDDPHLDIFKSLNSMGVVDLRVLPAVGCEKFAEFIYLGIREMVDTPDGRKWLQSVEVREHAGNSAIYQRDHG